MGYRPSDWTGSHPPWELVSRACGFRAMWLLASFYPPSFRSHLDAILYGSLLKPSSYPMSVFCPPVSTFSLLWECVCPVRQGPSSFCWLPPHSSEGYAHGQHCQFLVGWIIPSREIKQDLSAQSFVLVLTLASSSFPIVLFLFPLLASSWLEVFLLHSGKPPLSFPIFLLVKTPYDCLMFQILAITMLICSEEENLLKGVAYYSVKCGYKSLKLRTERGPQRNVQRGQPSPQH